MANKETTEQAIDRMANEAINAVKKDTLSVAEKYALKFGTTDGEATEREIDELVKHFES